MAISNIQVARIVKRLHRITWEQTDETLPAYVYLFNRFIGRVYSLSYELHVPAGTAPVLFITDDPDEQPHKIYPASARIQWQRVNTADVYRIEKYNGSGWDAVGEVSQPESRYCHYETPPLADVTAHQYRVITVTAAGVESAATAITFFMVRNPDPPSASFVYSDSTKKLTVTIA